jgi:hypothetical protein
VSEQLEERAQWFKKCGFVMTLRLDDVVLLLIGL